MADSSADIDYRDILDGLPDPVLLIDNARRVLRMNRAAAGIFDAAFTGRDLAVSLRHPDVLQAADTVLAGEAVQRVEVTLGRTVPQLFRVHVSATKGGGAMLVLHDITATRNAEEMRADFVANVSHELRSPLSSLIGFIETIRGAAREDDAAKERFLAIMESEALRMSRLIGDLLSLSKVEADEHIPPEDFVMLPELLGGIADSLSVRARERNMTIRFDIADPLPAVIGDQDELTLVFQNLAANAISYGREGTDIVISCETVPRIPDSNEAGVAVAVRDHGDGIAAEQLPRLTERFYRIDKGRSRKMGGTGLGLAIVKHIVSRHRGRLTIDSTLGQGSTFTVYLPGATLS